MRIINIFQKYEYMIFLKCILLNIISFIFIYDFVNKKIAIIIIICIHIFYYLFFIFLESEFDSKSISLIQIELEKKISLFSLIFMFSAVLTIFNFILYSSCYIYYKNICPFILHDLDLKLHLKKRCELYNTNKNSSYPFKYICTFNPKTIFFPIYTFVSEKYYEDMICYKLDKLIKNNKIIDEFINEYYKEPDIFYCDLKNEPLKIPGINPKNCDLMYFYPEFLIVIQLYSLFLCFRIISTYFTHIRANVNNYVHFD